MVDKNDLNKFFRGLRILVIGIVGGCVLAYAIVVVRAAWDLRPYRNRYAAQRSQALQLGLTYEAVRLASKQVSNQPVLWELGRTGNDWYYQADMNKPVLFTNPPELQSQGHKGMNVWTILALVRGAGPQGVFLEYLRDYD